MDLAGGIDKVKKLLNNLVEALKKLLSAPGKVFARFFKKFTSIIDRFPGENFNLKRSSRSGHWWRVPAGKRRPILIALGGLVIVLIILIISSVVLKTRGGKKDAFADIAAGPFIPVEELFIPGEPDFVPDFIPGREPRNSWTLEDIRPYWRNPGTAAETRYNDLWRGEIKSAVDKLLEGVP